MVFVGVSGGLGLVDRLICRYDFLGYGNKATLRVQTSDYFYLTEKHLLLVKPLTLHAKLGFMRAHRGITPVTSEGGVGRTLGYQPAAQWTCSMTTVHQQDP